MIKTHNVGYSVFTNDYSSDSSLNHSHETPPLTILSQVNLNIQAGESVAIVGASGSGKSTLLGMLAGLDQPSEGSICIDGKDITLMSEEQRAAMRSQYVGFVFQNFQLLPALNAYENVALPLEIKNRSDAKEKALHYLDHVGLSQRVKHYPSQLSGGEQQRVAIARAFACEAAIIFADEPTGNLDSITGELITNLLFDLNESHQTTLVLVTHSDVLAKRCNRQLRMSFGSLSEERVNEHEPHIGRTS